MEEYKKVLTSGIKVKFRLLIKDKSFSFCKTLTYLKVADNQLKIPLKIFQAFKILVNILNRDIKIRKAVYLEGNEKVLFLIGLGSSNLGIEYN